MAKTITVQRRVYLSRDGRAVPFGSKAEFLLFPKGQEITVAEAEKYGLIHRDPEPIHRDPVVVPAPPPAPVEPEPQVEAAPVEDFAREASEELTQAAPAKRRGRKSKIRV
jgi:enoyl-CoA hydratase/carnithine racemase